MAVQIYKVGITSEGKLVAFPVVDTTIKTSQLVQVVVGTYPENLIQPDWIDAGHVLMQQVATEECAAAIVKFHADATARDEWMKREAESVSVVPKPRPAKRPARRKPKAT